MYRALFFFSLSAVSPPAKTRYAWSTFPDDVTSLPNETTTDFVGKNGTKELQRSSKGTLIPSGQDELANAQGEITQEASISDTSYVGNKSISDEKNLRTVALVTTGNVEASPTVSQELFPLVESTDSLTAALGQSPSQHKLDTPNALPYTDSHNPPLLEILTTFDEGSENERRVSSVEVLDEGSVTSGGSEMEEAVPLPQGLCLRFIPVKKFSLENMFDKPANLYFV